MDDNAPTSTFDGSTPRHRWTEIRRKLEQAKACLVTAGCVVKRGDSRSRERWVCRYRQRIDGKVRHRNIYLGDGVFARRAEALIRSWRAEPITPEQRRRKELLHLWDLTAECRGYSARARQRLREAAKRCLGDRAAELRFAVGLGEDNPEIRYGRRPGRPARSRLW